MKQEVSKLEFDGPEVLDQIRERWLANMRHELSGPLFTSRGYLRLVLESQDAALPESHRRYLARALENLDKVVTYARELNNCPVNGVLELASFNFGEVLSQALAEVHPFLDGRKLQLSQELSELELTIIGDRNKLTEALRGFLSATMQSTNSAGTVEVAASENYGQIRVQLTGSPFLGSSDSQPDISGPSSLWRLHGGSAGACWSDGRYLLVCELPVIQPPES